MRWTDNFISEALCVSLDIKYGHVDFSMTVSYTNQSNIDINKQVLVNASILWAHKTFFFTDKVADILHEQIFN